MKNKPQYGKSNIISSAVLVLVMIAFLVFYIYPLFKGVMISFTDWNGMSNDYNYVGFDNYVKMFSDTRFQNAICVTLKYTSVLVVSCLVFGYVSAKGLSVFCKRRSFLLFVSFFPYVVTPVIVCILWSQLYVDVLPSIGKSLDISFLSHNVLANKDCAIFAVSVVDLWMLIPYTMILILSSLNSIPKELLEYAKLEGADGIKKLVYIELPYMLPSIGMIVTVIFSYAFTGLDTIMMLTAGGPGRSTETIYYVIYKNSTLEQRYGFGIAEGVFVSLLSIAVFVTISMFTNFKNDNDITMGT